MLSSLVTLLGALLLPPHVGGPGAGHLTLGGGYVEGEPLTEVRLGLTPWLSIGAETTWHTVAPRMGGQLKLAAGSARERLFAHAVVEGHIRPILGEEALSGMDARAGVGLTALMGPVFGELSGGLALGMPVQVRDDVPEGAIDQQKGLLGTQRIALGLELFDRLALVGEAALAYQLKDIELAQEDQSTLGQASLWLGGRLLFRL